MELKNFFGEHGFKHLFNLEGAMKRIISLLTLLILGISCGRMPRSELIGLMNEALGPDNQITIAKEHTSRMNYIILEQDGTYYALNVGRVYRRYYKRKYGPWRIGNDSGGRIVGHNLGGYFNNHRFKVTKTDVNSYRGPLGWVYEKTEASPKDLEKVGFLKEVFKRERIQNFLIDNYALSEERAQELSHLLQVWSKRSLSKKEQNIFSYKVLGISPAEVEKMYTERNEDLIEKAAEINDITPEHFEELMNDFLKR